MAHIPSTPPTALLELREPEAARPARSPLDVFALWRAMTRRQRFWIFLWCAFLVVPSAVMTRVLAKEQRDYVKEAIQRHRARLSGAEPGQTVAERSPPPGHERDVPDVVNVGIYLDRIPDLAIVSSSWKADFYVWFSWNRADLNPGETFQVINGQIESRTLLRKSETGGQHYALYRVVAEITKAFDIARFPRDEHMLTISIEDQALQSYQLVYAADLGASDISSRVTVPGYSTVGVDTAVKPHSYRTTLGDRALPRDYKATFSQFLFGVSVARSSWGLFTKMFVALYLAMGLAIAGLLLRSAGERLALGGTALFVAIMNAETVAPLIPNTGTSTLADVINGIGYTYISVIIIQAIIYQKFVDHDEADAPVARAFDLCSLVLITTLFLGMNVGVLTAATSTADESLQARSGRAPLAETSPT